MGVYGVLVEFPKNYPWVAPSLSFQTPIWHPNVCPVSGEVELGALFPQWLMSMSIVEVLRKLVELLRQPVVEDLPDELPAESNGPSIDTVRYQFLHDNPLFLKVAERKTRKSLGLEPLLPQLCRGDNRSSVFLRTPPSPALLASSSDRLSCRGSRRFRSVYQPSRPLLI